MSIALAALPAFSIFAFMFPDLKRDRERPHDYSAGTPGGTRTPNLRFWRPLLCQLSYWRIGPLDSNGKGASITDAPRRVVFAVFLTANIGPASMPDCSMKSVCYWTIF